jgi:hypothetical protein
MYEILGPTRVGDSGRKPADNFNKLSANNGLNLGMSAQLVPGINPQGQSTGVVTT